jgi:hypothetical protein
VSAKPWIQFRQELCSAIDQRCAKTSFKFEQQFMFIYQCHTIYTRPGTRESTVARGKIHNQGAFLLVADSLDEFDALFLEPEVVDEPNQEVAPEPEPTSPQDTAEDRPLVDAIKAEMEDVQEPPPASQRSPARPSLRHPQPGPVARQQSGRPFRPGAR